MANPQGRSQRVGDIDARSAKATKGRNFGTNVPVARCQDLIFLNEEGTYEMS